MGYRPSQPSSVARDGKPHALDGRNLLPQLVVQFACDSATLLLNAHLDDLGQLAVLGQSLRCFLRLLPGYGAVLH